MFDIVFKHFKQPGYYILAQALSQIYYFDIWFSNCTFTRNTNMKTLINIRPPNTHTGVALITISLSTISDNKNVTFIEVQWEFQTIHYRIIYISLMWSKCSLISTIIQRISFQLQMDFYHFTLFPSSKIVTIIISFICSLPYYT